MIAEFVLKIEGDKIEIFIHRHGDVKENVQEHWFDGESIFSGTQIPSSSATSVSKSELINAIKSCLVNFLNNIDINYKKLKENEEVKYFLIEFKR